MGARSSPNETLLGRIIDGRYRIDAFVGQGGYGIVCRGVQLSVDRQVAIKLLLPEHANDDEMQQRFAREARLASRIRNRHVVQLLDFGLAGAVPYIVMEWLKGPTLKQFQRSFGRLPWPIAAFIARDIAEGLHDAHELGLAHRDLKPSNVLLTTARGVVRPVIVDFGLAKTFSKESHSDEDTLTSANMMLGTPAYMAPETVAGDELDGRGDLYALGVLLCEMISGRLPFRGRTQMETATQHLVGKRPDAKFFANTDTPDEFVALIISMLDREPSSRPETAARVARMLDTFANDASIEQLECFYQGVSDKTEESDETAATTQEVSDKRPAGLDSAQFARLTTLFEHRPTGDELSEELELHTVAPRQQMSRASGEQTPNQPRGDSSSGEHADPVSEADSQAQPHANTARFAAGVALVATLAFVGWFIVVRNVDPSATETDDSPASGLAHERSYDEQTGSERAQRDRLSSETFANASSTIDAALLRAGDRAEISRTFIIEGTGRSDAASESAPSPSPVRTRQRSPSSSDDPEPRARTSRSQAGNAGADSSENRPVPSAAARSATSHQVELGPRPNHAPPEPSGAGELTEPRPTSDNADRGAESLAPVTIRSRPWAEIFVDGKSIGSHSVIQWQPPGLGSYLIRAVHGEDSRERRITVHGTEPANIRFMFVE